MNKVTRPLGWLLAVLATFAAVWAVGQQLFVMNSTMSRIEEVNQEINDNPRGLTGQAREDEVIHKTDIANTHLQYYAEEKSVRNLMAAFALGFGMPAVYLLRAPRQGPQSLPTTASVECDHSVKVE